MTDLFLVRESGGGGDCFFHSLAFCISQYSGIPVVMQTIRDELSFTITPYTVREFIIRISEDHQVSLPGGSKDFNQIVFPECDKLTTDQVKSLIRTPGESFQGNDICLRYLLAHSKYLRSVCAGAFVVTGFGLCHSQIYPQLSKYRKIYFGLFCNGTHWQAAQFKDQISNIYQPYITDIASLIKTINTLKEIPNGFKIN